MILQLLTNVYNDSNIYRNDELKFCLQQNCIAGFDRYHFFIDTKTLAGSYLPKKSYIHISSKRPTFKDFFRQMDDDAINVMANSDIVFKPETLEAIRNFYENCEDKEHTCLALSRWDVDANDRAVHFDRHDSQDTWIFYGKPKFTGYADFNLGKAGCDNRIAHEIAQSGFTVINNSKTIKTYHYHNSNIRNYLDETGRVIETIPPPYLLIPTTY